MQRTTLSAVIPVYRGEPYLRDLVTELDSVRKELLAIESPLELVEAIFVDDASQDASAVLLEDLKTQYGWIRVLHLSRNFGQHPATVSGILHSAGDWVATLDEDLQHPPTAIATLLREAVLQAGDLVYGVPLSRPHRWYRNLASRGAKALAASLAGNPTIRIFSSFRLIRGSIARAAAAVATHDTYFDIVLSWFTRRVSAVRLPLLDRRTLASGRSGYTLAGLVRHARRLLVSSDLRLLRMASLLGMAVVLGSLVLSAFVIALKLINPQAIALRGWTSLVLSISFFGGLNAFLGGVILEYLSILLLHVHGKPTFFVVDRSEDQSLREWFARR